MWIESWLDMIHPLLQWHIFWTFWEWLQTTCKKFKVDTTILMWCLLVMKVTLLTCVEILHHTFNERYSFFFLSILFYWKFFPFWNLIFIWLKIITLMHKNYPICINELNWHAYITILPYMMWQHIVGYQDFWPLDQAQRSQQEKDNRRG